MSVRGEWRPGPDDPAATVERAFREERAAVLATLIRQVGDFQLAEDAVQDAFASAVATWSRDGVPANPGAWITVAARRRAIDRLRRDRSLADRTERLAELTRQESQAHMPDPDDSGDRGRPPAADVHLLPPGARAAGPRGADAAHARRPDHRRDCPRLPRRRAHHGSATRASQAQDHRRGHPLSRALRRCPARSAARRAQRGLPDLQ